MKPFEAKVAAWLRAQERKRLVEDVEDARRAAVWDELGPVIREHQQKVYAIMQEHGEGERYSREFGHFGRTGWLSGLTIHADHLELEQSYSCRGSNGVETIRLPLGYLTEPRRQLEADIEAWRAHYTARDYARRQQQEAEDHAEYMRLKKKFEH